MDDLSKRLAELSPEKRRLLAQALQQRGTSSNAFPLSFAQQRLWFLDQWEPGNPTYTIAGVLHLNGSLHTPALARSLQELARRHEILRTTFIAVAGQPVQIVQPRIWLPLPVLDLRDWPASERAAYVRATAAAEARRPFDLVRGPLVRFMLLRLDDQEHALLLTMHHIIADGWSLGVFSRDLAALYAAFSSGTPPALPALPIQYADYAVWQRQWLQGSGRQGDKETRRQGDKEQGASDSPSPTPNTHHPTPNEEQLAYWRQQFAVMPAALELPSDRPRPAVRTVTGARHALTFPRSQSDALMAMGQRDGATLFMTLLAAWKLLLARYTDHDDIVVGTPIANRTRAETEPLIGYFVNTLALRSDLSGNPPFRELLGQVRQLALGAYAHQDLPFEQLVEVLQPERDPGRTPLFQVLFALQNTPPPALEFAGLTLRSSEVETGTAKFDLTLDLTETPQGLRGWFEYNSDLFDAATIARMAGHLRNLLEGIVATPEGRVAELPLLSAAEREQLLVAATGADQPLPAATLPQLWRAQLARTPDAVAVVFDRPPTTDHRPPTTDHRPTTNDHPFTPSPLHPFTPSPLHPFTPQHLSYAELDRRALQLARYLSSCGVGPDVLVALLLPRSPDLLVALLAVLLAEGAYLPLDPASPPARLAALLADAQPAVLLTIYDLRFTIYDLRSSDNQPPELKTQNSTLKTPLVVRLDAPWPLPAAPAALRSSPLHPDHLAYVIYTSGSTGSPKGVLVTQRGLLNYLAWASVAYARDGGRGAPLHSSLAVDLSVTSVWVPLLAGRAVELLAEDDPTGLGAALERAPDYSLVKLTPTHLELLLQHADARALCGTRQLVVGGEALRYELLARLWALAPHLTVINEYGPTETVVGCCVYWASSGPARGAVPIGKPITNTALYVLDRSMQLLPLGVAGELYVGGTGLARGYLKRAELTAERFVPNPFARVLGDGWWVTEDSAPNTHHLTPDTRLYKTGDRVRWRADGQLEYLGRLDEQVKVRGYRVEPGEVAAVLAQHPGVAASVVLARAEESGVLRLVAYLVTSHKSQVTSSSASSLVTRHSPALSGAEGSLVTDVRAFLKERLPEYMVPSAVVVLDELPLTPSGKVDYKALPAPDAARPELETPFVAPSTPVEEGVARVWAELLGVKQIGIHDNFFALGGHSLLATQVLSRLRDMYAVELPLRSLFTTPIVAGIAAQIDAARQSDGGLGAPPLRPVARDRGLPLSFAQQRLWFLDQLEPDNPFYVIPGAVSLTGRFSLAALAHALDAIMRRHEALRTTFATVDGQPVQVIAPALRLTLPVLDLRAVPISERRPTALRLAAAEARRPFDLARGPLVRTTVLRLDDSEQVLLLMLHHIVADGWSLGVFLRELTALYGAYAAGQPARLPTLPIQYADYAVWQREWLQGSGVRGQGSDAAEEQRTKNTEQNREHHGQGSGVRGQGSARQGDKETGRQGDREQGASDSQSPIPNPQSPVPDSPSQPAPCATLVPHPSPPPALRLSPIQVQLAYWKQQLGGQLPVLELPTDRPRPPVQTFNGARLAFQLPKALHVGLQALGRETDATLFMLLLAALTTLLYRYTGQEDVVVGTPIAGRTRAETEPLIGCFVNTLALRADLRGNPPFRELLGRVRTVALGAYAHQDLPFEKLVEELQPERDLRHAPLFQAAFVLENAPAAPLDLAGVALQRLEIDSGTAKSDLTLFMAEDAGALNGSAEYNTDLFDAATIERLLGHLRALIERIAAAPDLRIADAPLLTPAEREQLLIWNATTSEYPHDRCIHELFAAQAARTPDAVALVFDRGQGSGVGGQGDKETRRHGDKETEDRRSSILDPRSSIFDLPSSILHPQSLTYSELNQRADRLAQHLHGLGVGPEVRVGLCVPRSPELVIGLLGVLKAGGAYAPLDPSYPAERLAFMLDDAEVAALITTTNHSETRRQGDKETESAHDVTLSPPHPLTLSRRAVVDLRADWPTIAQQPATAPASVKPDNLAYIIYTSGSTGTPKGVLVSHRNVVHSTSARLAYYRAPVTSFLLLASFAFDSSVAGIFWTLCQGGRLVLPADDLQREPPRIAALIDAERVSHLTSLPSFYGLLLAQAAAHPLESLREVVVAGEVCPRDLLERQHALLPRTALFNEYGPTEGTVWSSVYACDVREQRAQVPIGHPITNMRLYVLDTRMEPAPIGIPGELYLGGAGLARGYHRRPDLTAERFVPNPFGGVLGDGCWVTEDSTPNTQHPTPITRLYRTGDRVRWLADGNLEFLGRVDQQVKVRGYRVEPEEIEVVLRGHPAVHEVAVLARTDRPGDTRLVAYVVQGSGVRGQGSDARSQESGVRSQESASSAPNPQSLIPDPRSLIPEWRAFLQARLPEYMLPAAFVVLRALPLTPTGKIDRAALPAPQLAGQEPGDQVLAPRTPVEELLAAIWADVLGVAQVGADVDFFELGGHSLLATQVVSRVCDAFQIELPLRNLFEAPTVAGLAARIEAVRRGGQGLQAPPIMPIARDEAPPLSFAQQRLWFLDQLAPDNPFYNIPSAVRLSGPLDLGALRRAFDEVVRRHEALRTTFATVDGQPVQVIAPSLRVALPLVDLRALDRAAQDQAVQRRALEEDQRPFGLARGPLMRVALLQLGAQEHVLLLTIHHIVADVWSIGVLIRELAALYTSALAGEPSPLPALPVQYADFAVWQRAWLEGSGRQGDKETRRQEDKETEDATPATQNSKLKTQNFAPIPHPSPPPALRLSPLQAQLAYWKRQLAGLATLQLPTDHPRPAVETFRGAAQYLALPAGLTQALKAMSRRRGVTLFMALLAAFETLLARYSGQHDIVVGSPIANRTRTELEELIGFFANTLVLRADLAGDLIFDELLARVRGMTLAAYEHQDIPFEKLVEELQPTRDMSRHPLFQVMFVLQNAPLPVLELGDLALDEVRVESGIAKFDLTLFLWEEAEALHGRLEYNRDLFDAPTATRMLAHFQTLLEGVAADPARRLLDLPLLTAAQRQQLLVDWNDTRRAGMTTRCIHRLVEDQVARTPDAVAVIFDGPTTNDQRPTTNDQRPSVHPFTPSPLHPFTGQQLTYAELNARANQLAHELQRLGVGPDGLVGICLERSLDLVVAVLGVLKAGGAILALDPTYPPDRLAFMIADARLRVLLTQKSIYDLRFTIYDLDKVSAHFTVLGGGNVGGSPPTPPFSPNCKGQKNLVLAANEDQTQELKTQNSKFKTPVVVCLDDAATRAQLAMARADDPRSQVTTENLVYAMYTSGSTGLPKGIGVSHRGFATVLAWQRDHPTLGRPARAVQFATFGFCVSFQEIFATLEAGAPIIMLPEQVRTDFVALADLLEQQAVERLYLPFAALRHLAEVYGTQRRYPPLLREVITAGEQLQVTPEIARWFSQDTGCLLHNQYGASETHVVSNYTLAGAPAAWPAIPPIGRPISDSQIYLLDRALEPAPIGVLGEIYIGGGGLARGYLNDPALTATKFIPNPFGKVLGDGCWVLEDSASATQHPTPNTRLYKTGDLARYLTDGNIEYFGRADQQVKVRGFRIELGEVETVLRQHAGVRDVAVLAVEGPGQARQLVAYVVTTNDQRPTTNDQHDRSGQSSFVVRRSSFVDMLRDFLQARLPEYMVPAVFVMLESLPLNANGKLDRAALPAPDLESMLTTAFVAPRTPTEEVLAGVWAAVLGRRQVGVADNFFALGGHSLLATQVIARVRAAFAVELPLRSLFEAPTIAGLAARVELARRDVPIVAAPPMVLVVRDRALPLSFAQQRLWFIDQLEPDNPSYTIPAAMRLIGPIDLAALHRSLNGIVRRHEVLRATFVAAGGQPVQVINEALPLPLPLIDLRRLPLRAREAELAWLATREAQRTFDLARGPLLRATLVRLDDAEHALLVMMHHIITDGWSLGIFMRELAALYEAGAGGQSPELPDLPIQYADFAVWQRAWLQGSGVRGQGSARQGDTETRRRLETPPPTPNTQRPTPLEAQLGYWRQRLAGSLPVLELPADRPRPAVLSLRGTHQTFALPAALADALTLLSRQADATVFMVLLAAFQSLLYRYSGQEDLLIGTPIAGRTRAETEPLIGFFVNTLVLRTDLSGAPSFRALLGRVRDVCLGAYAHQDLPFEMLVEELQPTRDLSHTPLFQVVFALQNAPMPTLELPSLTLRPLDVDSGTAKFDLTLSMEQADRGLIGALGYPTDLFDAATIARMLGHFQTLLENAVTQPDLPIADASLLTVAERRQLLVEWNATDVAYPQDVCLHQLFEAQAARSPDAVALVYAGTGDWGLGIEDKETRRQGDKETRRQGLPRVGTRGDKETRPSAEIQPASPNTQHPTPNTQHVTYDELNRRANRLGHRLLALGVAPDTHVAICAERSAELVVGLLGILKAGAAYVPLDPAYPEERLAFMLEDSQAAVLITTTGEGDKETRRQGDKETSSADSVTPSPFHPFTPSPLHPFTVSQPVIVDLRADWRAIAAESPSNPVCRATPDNLAYVIYTSGSTGRPKGVMISHRGICNRLLWGQSAYRLATDDRVLQKASFSFDASIWEIFWPLSVGACLVLARPGGQQDADYLVQLVARQRISIIHFVPSMLQVFLEQPGLERCASLRRVFCGGEPLPVELQERCLERLAVALHNQYGPTETSVNATFWTCQRGRRYRSVPIGRPIDNMRLYLLDARIQPVPIGVPGELYIGGAGLGRGYLGRPNLTAEKFVPNPFVDKETRRQGDKESGDATTNTQHPTPNTRLYRTGDRVRYRPDGGVEFLGRIDHQVKLRGFRVELGEIESVLLQHPAVRETAVLMREDVLGDRRLVAYVVTTNDQRPTTNDQHDGPDQSSFVVRRSSFVDALRAFLKERLPDYMLPAAFVELDALPLSPNGKVDRRALPAPGRARVAPEDSFVAPRTPVEELLAQIWADVLGLERVGVRDQFFDLGGHSLLATQVIARLREAFQVELPLRSVFEAPTVAGLAERVELARAAGVRREAPPILPVARDRDLPLSFAQQRLWFLYQLDTGNPAYNMPAAVRLSGQIDAAALERSLNEIVRRHEALRTTFATRDGHPTQVIVPALALELPIVDLRTFPTSMREAEVGRLVNEMARRSFDLARGPLIRITLLRLADAEHVLLVTIYHIVADGWSIGVFVRELAAIYAALSTGQPSPLPELPVQYADYAVWQRAWLQGSGVMGQGDKETRRQGDKEIKRSAGTRPPTPDTQHPTPIQAQLAYWKRQLADLPVLELPTDRPRPEVQTFQGAKRSFALPGALSDALLELSRRESATLFMTLLAAFQVLLGRYTDHDDIVVGTPIANRTHAELEPLIGVFVNTLVLRADLAGNPSFRALLARMREMTLDAYAHQDLPFELLVDELQPARDLSRNPLFQVMFVLQNAPMPPLEFPGLTLQLLESEGGTSKFDLWLSMVEGAEGLGGFLEYNSDLFDAATIARMLNHFAILLEGIVATPEGRVAELPLLSAAEREQLLAATGAEQPLPAATLPQLWRAQLARTPDAAAVVFDRPPTTDQRPTITPSPLHPFTPSPLHPFTPQHLSYAELDRRALQLARYLTSCGVGPDVLVALLLPRSPDLLVALLAVLLAEGAYLPLDPASPPARLAALLADAQPAVLLTIYDLRFTIYDLRPSDDQSPELKTQNSKLKTPLLVCLDAPWPAPAAPAALPLPRLHPDHLAYVIYTSGSTGAPKGVLVTQRGLVNYLAWASAAYARDGRRGAPLHSSLAVDLSITSVWVPLLVGRAVELLAEDDPTALGAALERAPDYSLVKLTPTHLELLLQHADARALCGTRQLVVGGEALRYELLARLWALAPHLTVVNEYGPTETVVGCCVYWASGGPARGAVPIGKSITNTALYVLDRSMQLLPLGVAGELYVGGAGLARGYLKRAELTAAAFIPNPFADQEQRTKNKEQRTENQEPRTKNQELGTDDAPATQNSKLKTQNLRLYRTGDRVRWRSDGQLEYLGRLDEQVKVRGYRVEPSEVAAVLNQHPEVGASVVMARAEAGGPLRLVAYVVPKIEDRGLKIEDSGSSAPDPLSSILYPLSSELRGFLQTRLPDYMIPAAMVVLDELPLTPSGKVDYKALPAPDTMRPELGDGFDAPRTTVEQVLADIWSSVLHVDSVGVNDNFFALGGDSILSLQIVAKAQQAGLQLAPRQLFQYQTIAELASVTGIASAVAAEQGLVEGPVPLTPVQHWFFARDLPDPHHFNQAVLLELWRPLDPALLDQALGQLLAHHDALRLRFVRGEHGWQQTNAGIEGRPAVLRVDLSALPPAEQQPAIEAAAAAVQVSLDLARGPLMRAALFDCGAGRPGRLLLVIHHLAVDGVSWRILLEDLQTACEQLSRGEAVALPPKTTAFQRWAELMLDYAQSEALWREEAYWLALPWHTVARLRLDNPGGANTVALARTVTAVCSAEETQALLYEVPEVYRTQINDLLLTALAQAWARWTRVRTLLVDLESHGREASFADVDLSRTVGWCTTLYPALLDLAAADGPGAALKTVKEQLRTIPNHGAGYGLLRYQGGDAEIAERLRVLPQPEILFNYLGQIDQALPQESPFRPAQELSGPTRSPRGDRPYVLEVSGLIAGGQLQFEWTYGAELLERATVEVFAETFMEALRALIAHCQSPEAGGYTLSDFPLAHVEQDELDEVFGMIEFEGE